MPQTSCQEFGGKFRPYRAMCTLILWVSRKGGKVSHHVVDKEPTVGVPIRFVSDSQGKALSLWLVPFLGYVVAVA